MTRQRSAFKYLSDLMDSGYMLFRENGRLGIWLRHVYHGAPYEMALLTDPLEYRSSRRGAPVTRDQLLDQTPVSDEELHAAEVALFAVHNTVGDELTQLMEWGWEFPDAGRISFEKHAGLGAESDVTALKAYLDKKDHVVYELGGLQVPLSEAEAWLEQVEGGRGAREAALLSQILQKLKDAE